MAPPADHDRSGQFRRVPRVNSGITCGVCSGVGGESGHVYIEQFVRFVRDDVAMCPNCGVRYVWSAVTVTLRRTF